MCNPTSAAVTDNKIMRPNCGGSKNGIAPDAAMDSLPLAAKAARLAYHTNWQSLRPAPCEQETIQAGGSIPSRKMHHLAPAIDLLKFFDVLLRVHERHWSLQPHVAGDRPDECDAVPSRAMPQK